MNKLRVSFYFSLNEFECPCCKRVMIDERLLEKLEALRILWGKPLIITSGYRCESYNKEIGGVPNSLHMRGQAADLAIPEREQGRFLTLSKLVGLRVIPYPSRNFIHVELGGDGDGYLSGGFEPRISDSSKFLSINQVGEGDQRA